jgi:hypothetical protein
MRGSFVPQSPVRRIVQLLRLPASDRRALVLAAGLVAGVRVALAVLPFQRVLRAADRRATSRSNRAPDEAYRLRTIWAVETAARALLPAGPCLSQAIVADMLLRRSGYASELHIGVAHGPRGELRAHAWVESNGEVVIGGAESPSAYSAFPRIRPLP